MKKINFLLLVLFLFFFENVGIANTKIILKLDDLIVQNEKNAAKPTMDYLLDKRIKFSFGTIANRLDKTAYKTLYPYLQATDSCGDRLLEIWHHGYDHLIPEFSNHDYAYQNKHFKDADDIFNFFFNIQFKTFGAPGNANDSITTKVFLENTNYHVYFLSNAVPKLISKNSFFLNQRVEIENGMGNVNFDFFVKNYKNCKNKYTDYMILQGHPNAWGTNKLEEFKKIIDFLLDNKCEFTLPYDYYIDSVNLNNPQNLETKKSEKNNIDLKWIDTNNTIKLEYLIERSEDSLAWEKVAIINNNYDNRQVIDTNKKDTNNIMEFIDEMVFSKSGTMFYKVRTNTNKKYVSNITKIIVDKGYNEPIIDNSFKVYPNPCAQSINIIYKVDESGQVSGSIYDLSGRCVKNLFNELQVAGTYQKNFDITSLNSGVYSITLNSKRKYFSRKVIKTK